MSQDIDYIKKEIRKCEEVISPFDLKKGDIVRYITLDNGVEYFYDGGEYIGMSENRIQLKGKNVPIVFMNNEGEVLYRTRFFVKNDNEMSGVIKEYEEIISNQQRIIDTLTRWIKKLDR